MTNSEFLPADYSAPSSSGNYMKFQDGENRFRILSKPIVGWEDWKDKKPIRFRLNEKPAKPVDANKPIKHFWAMIVWNVLEEKIQILEITQSTIQKAIQDLSKDEDWGSPFEYDIKVKRTGDGMETKYSVNPVPHSKLSQQARDEYKAKGKINLEALYEGADPFSEPETKTEEEEMDKLPF